MRPSERIAELEERIRRARYLDGAAMRQRALEIYLDERAGYELSPTDPLLLAEKAVTR